jgi:GT2 family glycosyltransferase
MLRIVIPTYNRSIMVSNLVDNLVLLGGNIEIVVVDDCSNEENKLQLRSLNVKYSTISNLRIVFNKTNTGGAGARNIGAYLSGEYDYLWFLDDDDLLVCDNIDFLIEFLTETNAKIIFLPAIHSVDGSENKTVPEVKGLFSKFRRFGHQVNTSCCIFSKALFEQLNGWDSSLVAGQDTDLLLRASQLSDAELFNQLSIKVIEHDGERITTNWKKQMKGKYQFLVKHWHTLHIVRTAKYFLTLILFIPYLKNVLKKK